MPSDRYQRNPRLVVSDLGATGYVVYVPPESKPLRFSTTAWMAIDALAMTALTHSQLQNHLTAIPPDHDNSESYIRWLLTKRVLLPVDTSAEDQSVRTNDAPRGKVASGIERFDDSGDIGEGNSIHLFTLNPVWPTGVQKMVLFLLRLQIWMVPPMMVIVLAYLCFFLLTPTPSAVNLLGVGASASTKADTLARIVIGLFGVNLLSTVMTWLAQSVTGLGDGKVILRFLFGFIPRFGVNPYKGAAMTSKKWSQESERALFCIAQPLLARLGLASTLILLLASGRLHNGLAGPQSYVIANIVLHISLFTGLIMALPFRISPGYRLMILLTRLPPNTLVQSVRHLYSVVEALIRFVVRRDRPSRIALKNSVSSWGDFGLLVFAFAFFVLIAVKLFLILFVAIPTLSSGLPDILGGASEIIFAIILLALLLRFIKISIITKFSKLRNKRSSIGSAQSDMNQHAASSRSSSSQSAADHPRSKQSIILLCLIIGLILCIPINRTVSGSVVVSTERDLTVRAPADVRITGIFQSGPSAKVIPQGTPLIQLQSQQLDRDLYQSSSELEELRNELSTLTEQRQADSSIINELRDSLKISNKATQLLENQLLAMKTLTEEGAFSQKMTEDILLNSYELQENEKLKVQQFLELQAQLQTADLRIRSIQEAIKNSIVWKQSLEKEKIKMKVEMPFDGLITSSTSGLMWSFVSKGESLLELTEGSLNLVNILLPDHDRSLVKIDQKAEVRLYAQPNQPLDAVIQSIRPSSELIDDKVYFQASLRLSEPLSPQLLQSSGAARIKTGTTNLFLLIIDSLGRFVQVDLWSWSP